MYDAYEFHEPEELKKRPSFLGRFLSWLFAAAMMLVLIGVAGAYYIHAQLTNDGPQLGEARYFSVERGNGLNSIARSLEQDGFIQSATMFRLGAMLTGKQRNLQAGEYEIPSGSSIESILDKMAKGEVVRMAVTIPEGFTSWQVVQRLKATSDLTGDITQLPVEGSLLPDTYDFKRGDTRQSVIDRMAQASQDEINKIWQGRVENLPIKTPQEMVILASIVEKETGIAKERDVVASVFINRLRKGMRLQSDPTIIYGITLGQGRLDGGIKRSQKNKQTEYNTYKINGLPPGPIANPGIESLKAVAQPAETDFLYFVADGTGGHAFSKSYREHRTKVAAWRKIEKQQRTAAEMKLIEEARASNTKEGRAAATTRLYDALRKLEL